MVLSPEGFADFGDVISVGSGIPDMINDGKTERFTDLAHIDTSQSGGRSLLHIYRTKKFDLPLSLTMMERHPKGSQAFIPVGNGRFAIVVAAANVAPSPENICAFIASADQGVNLRRGVWHHPMMPIDGALQFLVIERGADDENCDVIELAKDAVVLGR